MKRLARVARRLHLPRLSSEGRRRVAVIAAVVYMTVITGWSYAAQNASRTARRHDNCIALRNLYDGQIKTVRFIGQKLGATEAQIDAGLHDLRVVLGKRPTC